MSSRCDGSYGQRVVSHFGPPARGSRNSAGDVRCRSTAGECRAVNTNVCERGYSEEASAGWQQGMVKACGSTPVPNPSQATGSDGSWVPLSASDGLRRTKRRLSLFLKVSIIYFTDSNKNGGISMLGVSQETAARHLEVLNTNSSLGDQNRCVGNLLPRRTLLDVQMTNHSSGPFE